MTDNEVNNKGPDSERDVTPELRSLWRKRELLERALDNVDIWTAKLETSKKYLNKWNATAKRLIAELEVEEV